MSVSPHCGHCTQLTPPRGSQTCYPIQQVDKTPAFVFLQASLCHITWSMESADLPKKRVTENGHAKYHYCVILTRKNIATILIEFQNACLVEIDLHKYVARRK